MPFILKEHRQPEPFRPHDICVSAPTGSGKTLSFVLPIVQVRVFNTFLFMQWLLPAAVSLDKFCVNHGFSWDTK